MLIRSQPIVCLLPMHTFDFDKIDLRTVGEIDDAAGVVRKPHVVGPAAHEAARRQADGPVTRGLQRSEALTIEVDGIEPIRARSPCTTSDPWPCM